MLISTLIIPGLRLSPDWLSSTDADHLIALIDAQPWLSDLKRRVQHYGFRYDYRARRVTADMGLGPLPDWLDDLSARVGKAAEFARRPDQVIINEYRPGQGISPHIDCRPCFGPTITSLSLGGAVDMVFRHSERAQQEVLRLTPRSLLTLTGPARQDWQHGIPARKSDVVAGQRVPRIRRILLTFRTMCVSDA